MEPDFSIFPDEFKSRYRVLKVETPTSPKFKIQWRTKNQVSRIWHTVRYMYGNDEWSYELEAKRALFRKMKKDYDNEELSKEPINI